MSSTEVIYLNRRDTLESVRGLLEAYPAQSQVWLVAPFDMPVVANLVNLKLLRRAADAAAVDLRLVSLRREVRLLAREAGIAAYCLLPLVFTPVHRMVSKGPLIERRTRVPARAARFYRRKPRVRPFNALILTLFVVAVVLVLVVAAVGFLMPSAVVSLQPVTAPVEARFQVVADVRYHKADYERMVIPAREVEVVIEGRGDTPATGRLDVNEGRAEGEVVFSNKTNNAVEIPKGTVVRSGVGIPVRFYTLDEVTLPAQQYGTARARILAMDAGPIGNVGSLTINVIEGSLATVADVLNDNPTSGGTVKRVATVAYGDFDRLRADLSAKLQQEAFDQMVASLGEGEFIPASTVQVEILGQTSDQIVDQQAEMLAMTMKMQVRGLAVDGLALKTIAGQYLAENAVADGEVIPASLKAAPSGAMLMADKSLTFGVLASGEVGDKIDQDRVKRLIRGLEPEEAAKLLSEQFKLQALPAIQILPDWWPRMPYVLERIRVNIVIEAK